MSPLLFKPATVGAVICATTHSGRHKKAIMVNTVKGYKEQFTQRSVIYSKEDWKLAWVLFIPIGRTMEQIYDGHWLQHSPITCPSLVAANKFFGPNLNEIKGNKVLLKTPKVRINIANVPISIMSLYRNVTLASDILYFNKTVFLASISVSIKLSPSGEYSTAVPTPYRRP